MRILYTFFVYLYAFGMKVFALFNTKAKLGIKGRENTFSELQKKLPIKSKTIWMHCASLGEYEQGLPVLEALKKEHPDCTFVISFFSASGYEIIKKKSDDILFYLPFDFPKNNKKLLEILNPTLVVFVKYEFWYNLLQEIQQRNIPHIFISAIFRENQLFFKPFGKWFLQHLQHVTHFFVQDTNSFQLLENHAIENKTIAGDTRFERVKSILKEDNTIDWLEEFKGNATLIVIGSSWEKDEEVWLNYIQNSNHKNVKYLFAPHEIRRKLEAERKMTDAIYYSKMETSDTRLPSSDIFILDTIGLLTKVYFYADIAYVGGGFGKEGIHNILEPAVFGTPVVFGPVHGKFLEAEELISANGAISITDEKTLTETINKLVENNSYRQEIGNKASNYIQNKPNSVEVIMEVLKEFG